MTCQWRTELETSQWIVLIQKWKFCYLRNVTCRNQFVATTKTRVTLCNWRSPSRIQVMNIHASRTCEALRRWRILAEILLSKTNIDSFLPGMPLEKELSIKELCSLYIGLDRRLKHRAPRLSKPDDKRVTEQLGMYKRDYFSDNFGDGGYLAHMKEHEDDKGESFEDIIDTKYGTNLSLAWTSTDTKTATDLATKIRGNFRDETEGDGATAVEEEDWHSYIAFEVRHHIVAERSLLANKSRGKAKPSGE